MGYGTIVADKITTSDGYTLGGTGATMKNRIINGAMVIDQRNAGANVVCDGATSQYVPDRFMMQSTVASKLSAQQQTSVIPTGFNYATKFSSLTAYSVSAGDYFLYTQPIEGYNIADLLWGTSNAKPITLSFWAYSSLTGTFGGALDAGSGAGASYPFTYTINSANTWEQKTITIAGPTIGTWGSTNSVGVYVRFGLGVGSTYSGPANAWSSSRYFSASGATSVVGTNGATFYITGVQLEAGSQATSFDYRQYGAELQMCQRYYQKITSATYVPASCFSTNRVLSGTPGLNIMRATPTVGLATNAFTWYPAGAAYTSSGITATSNAAAYVTLDVTVTATAGASGIGSLDSAVTLSSEL